jgi:hypothetical protein
MINHGINKLKIINDNGAGSVPKNGGRIMINNGNETEANIEATETYPVKIMANIATARQNINAEGKSARSIPPNVPTPLPPLNPANIVYVCPKTAEKPHKI